MNELENDHVNNGQVDENKVNAELSEASPSFNPEPADDAMLTSSLLDTKNNFTEEIQKINEVLSECSKTVIGQRELLELMIVCLLCDGHILLEGVPGIAKTLIAKTLSKTIGSDFSRIQFTPDLMPSDIIGTSVFNMNSSTFEFKKGPIFSNIILIDEINRSPAKTQAALFEVMEEKQISFDGQTFEMTYPFLVIATQNPIEQEGTYRLPEAQLDRFMMKIVLGYPSAEEEKSILHLYKDHYGKIDLSKINNVLNPETILILQSKMKTVVIDHQIINYITNLVQETRNNGRIYLGASPRASLCMLKTAKAFAMLAGRDFVIPDDVQFVAPHVLNHRIIMTPEAEMSGTSTFDIIKDIIKSVEVPR